MHALIENSAVKKYPYTLGEVRKANPNTSLPNNASDATLESFSVYRVFFTTPPEHDAATQVIEEGTPVFNADRWEQVWAVRDLTAEELQARSDAQAATVREERNQRLKDTDWTQVADAPVDKAAWATHRQALRNIPDQPGFPWTVNWPVEP